MYEIDIHSLKELAEVVTKNKVKAVNVLGNGYGETRVHDFYSRLLSDEFDDCSAADYFFDCETKDMQYRRLKNKLHQKLVNTSFFIDTKNPKFNTHQKAYYNCLKNVMATRILIGRSARKSALMIARKTMSTVRKYEFSQLALELCRLLRSHFAIHTKNRALFNRYDRLADYYQGLVNAEEEAIRYYEHTCVLLKKRDPSKKLISDLCSRYLDQLHPYIRKYDSYRLHLTYYVIALRKVDLENDHHAIIEVCDKAIRFFDQKGFVSDQFSGLFYYHKLVSLVNTRSYVGGNKLANKCHQIFEKESMIWYNALQYSFIFSMHAENFKKALHIRNQVVKASNFKHQLQNRAETWHLYDAYLYYLWISKKLSVDDRSDIKKFRVRKFLNNVPNFAMDKRGHNIPILVIQILIQLSRKKYDLLSDKIEAIEKYTSRYLRKDSNYRSNCFIKMLLQIPKQNYNIIAIKRHTKVLRRKLTSMPLAIAHQTFGIEIIPYEYLWELTLQSLD